MLNDGIQGSVKASCISATPLLKWAESGPNVPKAMPHVITNTAAVVKKLISLISSGWSFGIATSSSAPRAGKKTIRLSQKIADCSMRDLSRRSEVNDDRERHRADDDQHDILTQ